MSITKHTKPLVIGLTGGSGSGKTSIVHYLKNLFSSEEVCFLSQDDYYRPREEQQTDDQGIKNFDLPISIDKKAFRKDIQRLIAGQSVVKQEYVFNNELVQPKMLSFQPAPILLIEGLFVFHYRKINALFDLRIFVEAKENLKVIRRIRRDRMERNYPLDDVLYRYQHHVLPTYEKYILPYRADADMIINNNEHFKRAAEVLAGYLRDHLVQIQAHPK